jgi:hypothetical protein
MVLLVLLVLEARDGAVVDEHGKGIRHREAEALTFIQPITSPTSKSCHNIATTPVPISNKNAVQTAGSKKNRNNTLFVY